MNAVSTDAICRRQGDADEKNSRNYISDMPRWRCLLVCVLSIHSLQAEAVRNGLMTQDDLAIYSFAQKGEQPRLIEQDQFGDLYGLRPMEEESLQL